MLYFMNVVFHHKTSQDGENGDKRNNNQSQCHNV